MIAELARLQLHPRHSTGSDGCSDEEETRSGLISYLLDFDLTPPGMYEEFLIGPLIGLSVSLLPCRLMLGYQMLVKSERRGQNRFIDRVGHLQTSFLMIGQVSVRP